MNKRFIEVVESLNFAFPATEISEKIGYSKGKISEYLNNKKKVPKAFLLKFCKAYKLNYDALFKENEIMAQAPKVENESDMALIILVHTIKDELLELIAEQKNKSLAVVQDDFKRRAIAKQKELLKRLTSLS